MLSTADKITTSVMSVQIALNQLEAIKHTSYYKQSLKNKLNAVLPELMNAERLHYDNFFEAQNESTAVVYDVFENFIKKMSSIPIYEMENIVYMITAFEKDPKSINGICNKILK